MTSNSEARKRLERAVIPPVDGSIAVRHQRRREVAQSSLEAIFHGADFIDADALLDQFEQRGARLVIDQ